MSSKRAMRQAQKQAFAKHRSNISNSRFNLKKSDPREDNFLKTEYILNLNELVMTRTDVYNEKT